MDKAWYRGSNHDSTEQKLAQEAQGDMPKVNLHAALPHQLIVSRELLRIACVSSKWASSVAQYNVIEDLLNKAM